ncbi:unnamed protein product, partial [Chrysoparadoxa australica]
QVDFHPGGSLAIPTADEDAARIAQFIRSQGSNIKEITVTLDTHASYDISHPEFWVDSEGSRPPPFTIIKSSDVEAGVWRPAKPDLQEHCVEYTKYLEEGGRFAHCIWPEHCIKGSSGHEVVAVIAAALEDWSKASGVAVQYVEKGENALTEHFSAFRAEKPISSCPGTQLNTTLLSQLAKADRVYVCGQALSHCVNYSMRDLAEFWGGLEGCKMEELVLLKDGASAVPGFEEAAKSFVADMAKIGCKVVTCAEV